MCVRVCANAPQSPSPLIALPARIARGGMPPTPFFNSTFQAGARGPPSPLPSKAPHKAQPSPAQPPSPVSQTQDRPSAAVATADILERAAAAAAAAASSSSLRLPERRGGG
ncbi:UNVERIFIED_CONTAM: hypothetical protein K2H54_068329, partial [Gekko kuhli]